MKATFNKGIFGISIIQLPVNFLRYSPSLNTQHPRSSSTMMLSSTAALRLTRSASPSLSNFTSNKTALAPSLCQLFDTSLRLSSTTTSHEPSPKIITTHNRQQHYPRNIQLQSPAFHLGTRYFSSKSDEPPSDDVPAASKSNTGNRQHETWVEFQASDSLLEACSSCIHLHVILTFSFNKQNIFKYRNPSPSRASKQAKPPR